MRRLLTTAILCAFVMAGQAQRLPADSVCTLTGDIRGLGNNRLIFNYATGDTGIAGVRNDTVRASSGHFVFTTHLKTPTSFHIYAITDGPPSADDNIGNHLTFSSKKKHHYAVFSGALLENRSIYVNSSIDSFRTAHYVNAPLNDTMEFLLKLYNEGYRANRDRWHQYRRQHPRYLPHNHTAAMVVKRDSFQLELARRQEDTIITFIRSHPSSYASANAIWMVMNSDSTIKRAVYNSLDISLRSLPIVMTFKRRIAPAGIHLSLGTVAPDIVLEDTSGHPVPLSSLRGRITLVDFWASWCGPCRHENPNVVATYKKYHKKGLEIYSVSLDNIKSRWTAAIVKDQLGWIHVSDLIGWQSPAVMAYGVRGIPDNFLLDRYGKIVGINLRGSALKEEVRKALRQ